MRPITFEQAKALKDAGIEIPESEVIGYWVDYHNGVSKGHCEYTEGKDWQFRLKEHSYNFKSKMKATDLEGLWNMLPKTIKIKNCDTVEKCLMCNRIYYEGATMIDGRYANYQYNIIVYEYDPKQAVIDMLVFLKQEGLM